MIERIQILESVQDRLVDRITALEAESKNGAGTGQECDSPTSGRQATLEAFVLAVADTTPTLGMGVSVYELIERARALTEGE